MAAVGKARSNSDLLEAVLSCQERVVVLGGPVRAGKTRAALDVYRHFQPDGLLLAPTPLAAEQLRMTLLHSQPSGTLAAPRVMTFEGLAGQILLAGGVADGRMQPIHQRAVVQGIVGQLAQKGQLKALGGVADTPGLLAAVIRTIAELKRANISAGQFAATIGSSASLRHRDVLAIYTAYETYLAERQLYDDEGLLARARAAIDQLDAPPWPGLRAVVVDGFTEFSATQLRILHRLAGWVERMLITLPHAEEPARGRLWHWTSLQRGRLMHAFGEECCTITLPGLGESPLDRLLENVFAVEPGPTDWPGELTLTAAAGMESECRAIARWAKARLAEGTSPHELAVVARDINAYRATLAGVFAEAGLPATTLAENLAEVPLGRLLTALVRLADGYHHSHVLAVVSSSYFRPAALGPFAPETASAAQLVTRQGNVVGGAEQYHRAARHFIARLERVAESGEDDDQAQPMDQYLRRLGKQAIDQADQMLAALFERVAPLSANGTVAEQAGACLALLDALRLPETIIQHGRPDTVAADLRSLAAIQQVLGKLASLAGDPAIGQRIPPWRFADVLTSALADTPCPPRQPSGAIRAVSAMDARALAVDHLWLAGMNEGAFPAPAEEKTLIRQSDRVVWASRGAPLEQREELARREMLLFYLAVSRARKTLTLSWLHSDTHGRSMERSGFVDALVRPAGGLEDRVTMLPPAEFAPPADRILSARELLNSALAAASSPGDSPRAAEWLPALQAARHHCRQTLAGLAGPLWAWHRRWAPPPMDAYDGVLSDPALLAELARLVPAEIVFSISQINAYLECPWRYFAQRWLKLTPLADPTEALLPRGRGLVIHAVLQRMISSLQQAGPVEPRSLTSPQAMEAMEAALQAEHAQAASGAVPYPALWESELRQIRQAVSQYLLRQANLASPPGQVSYLELGFGLPLSRHTDPHSTTEPLLLQGPGGAVKFQGKIDRVDVVDWPPGVKKAFVVDYKSGHVPSSDADVQLPVYIKAAEWLTGLPGAGGAFHSVSRNKPTDRYLAAFKAQRDGTLGDGTGFVERMSAALDGLHQAVAGIAAGQFPVMPQGKCTVAQCPFRRICGYSDSRALFKTPEEPAGPTEGGDA